MCPRVTGSQDKAGRHGHSGLLRMPERPVLKVFYFPEDRGKHLRTRLWLPWGEQATKQICVAWFTQGRAGGEETMRSAEGTQDSGATKHHPTGSSLSLPISTPSLLPSGHHAYCCLCRSPPLLSHAVRTHTPLDCVLSHHLQKSSRCLGSYSFHTLHSPVKVHILYSGFLHTYNIREAVPLKFFLPYIEVGFSLF